MRDERGHCPLSHSRHGQRTYDLTRKCIRRLAARHLIINFEYIAFAKLTIASILPDEVLEHASAHFPQLPHKTWHDCSGSICTPRHKQVLSDRKRCNLLQDHHGGNVCIAQIHVKIGTACACRSMSSLYPTYAELLDMFLCFVSWERQTREVFEHRSVP